MALMRVPDSGFVFPGALRTAATPGGGHALLERERASWRDYWSAYGDRSRERDVWWALDRTKFERLKGSLPPAGLSLEVGCGSARLSAFVGAEGYGVVGLDYCAEAAVLARNSFSRARVLGEVVMGEAERLPFDDASFDIVLSTGLLEHFEDPSPIVREMVRVLRPGGVFYSDVVPRKFSLMRALDGLRHGDGHGHGEDIPERPFTAAELRRLLLNSGLGAVRAFPAGVFPPRVPVLGRLRAVREAQGLFCFLTRRFWRALDGTSVAERLGLYYFCLGWKDDASPGDTKARDGHDP